MTTSLQTFEETIKKGDLKALKVFLAKTESSEKEKLSKKALSTYKIAVKGELKKLDNDSLGWRYNLGENVLKSAVHAVLATCNHEQLSKVSWNHSALRMVDWNLVKELKPIGLKKFGDILIDDSVAYFPFVRKLMKLALSDKPTSENYIVGIISCPNYIYSTYNKSESLKRYLNDEKDLLDDVIKVFEVEGTQEDSLASIDKYSSDNCNWQNTLIELCQEGVLDRSTLLDKALDALSCDYIQYRSSWFSRFYEAMEPTIEERSEHKEKYGLLLGSSIPTTVSFSAKALKKLSTKEALSKDFLSKNISPSLYAKSKATVNTSLSLIEKTMKSDKSFRAAGCLLISDCLYHESGDVQKKSLTLIEKYGDKQNIELVEKVAQNIHLVNASNLPLVKKWLDQSNQNVETDLSDSLSSEKVEGYSYNQRASKGWPFEFSKPVHPIETQDELIKVASFCLEHKDEVLEFERVVDAVSRIKIERNKQFEKDTSALKKRSLHFFSMPMYTIPHLLRMHAGFLYGWITKSDDVFKADKKSFFKGIFKKESFPHIDEGLILERERLKGVLERVFKDYYHPVVSTPTHQGGWILPDALVKRLQSYKNSSLKPELNDLLLAMSRCPNNYLCQYLEKQKETDQFIDVLSYKAGLIKKPPRIDKQLVKLANYLKEPTNPETKIDLGDGVILGEDDMYETAKWLLITFPSLKESYYFANLRYIKRCVEYMDVSDLRVKAAYEAMLETGAPLGDSALEFLSFGLIVEEASTRGLAAEVLIAAIEEQKLEIDKLSQFVSIALHSKDTKPKRLANSLGEVARLGALHRNAIRLLIEKVLTGDGTKAPKGLVSLLELLNELVAQEGAKVTNEDTLAYLKKVPTGGKTKSTIKQLI